VQGDALIANAILLQLKSIFDTGARSLLRGGEVIEKQSPRRLTKSGQAAVD